MLRHTVARSHAHLNPFYVLGNILSSVEYVIVDIHHVGNNALQIISQ